MGFRQSVVAPGYALGLMKSTGTRPAIFSGQGQRAARVRHGFSCRVLYGDGALNLDDLSRAPQ